MASCKDCIHERVCEKLWPKGLLPYRSGKYPAESFCSEFKNKADVVEIIRCKDCIYNGIGNCKHKADYFCANGTPKNEEEKNNDVFK